MLTTPDAQSKLPSFILVGLSPAVVTRFRHVVGRAPAVRGLPAAPPAVEGLALAERPSTVAGQWSRLLFAHRLLRFSTLPCRCRGIGGTICKVAPPCPSRRSRGIPGPIPARSVRAPPRRRAWPRPDASPAPG